MSFVKEKQQIAFIHRFNSHGESDGTQTLYGSWAVSKATCQLFVSVVAAALSEAHHNVQPSPKL